MARAAQWLWRLPASLLDRRGAASPESQPSDPESPAEVRARFWKAVREGRREAESRCAGRDPAAEERG